MSFLLNERHEVSDKRLGGGAFGDVWLGRDRQTSAPIAVKLAVAPSAHVPDTAIDDAFNREELALSQVRHPNVVSLLHSGRYEDRRFLVLEYVPGQSLWSIFQNQQINPTLPMMEKTRILCEVAHALGETHTRGFVHLDVKPENILVTPEGRVVLIDFGSSLSIGQARSRPVEIETGAYCAPEQIRGARWCSGAGLTPRTDVFAFGIVAWEILSLQRPFGDATAGHLQRVANESPNGSLQELSPECPEDLANLIGICLSKNPKSRYASMSIVAQRIENISALLASRAFYREGRIEAAILKAEEAIAASPDLPEARELAFDYSKEHVEALFESGETEKAREWLQRSRDHCSGNPEHLASIADLEKRIAASIYADRKIRALVSRAERDLQDGNAGAAAEYIAMAEKFDASHPLLQEFHHSRYAEIEQLLRVPDYSAAIERWRFWSGQTELLQSFPNSLPELERLRKKIWKQAESDVEQTLFVHDFSAANALIELLASCCSGDERSRDHLQGLVRMRDEQEAAYADSVHMVNLDLVSEGRYEEALARVDRALAILPDDTSLLSAKTGLTRSVGESRDTEAIIRREIEAGAIDRVASLLDHARESHKLSTARLLEFDRWLSRERQIHSAIEKATTLTADGKHDEAIENLGQLLVSYPADPRIVAAKAELDARIHADALNSLVAMIEQTMDAGDLDYAAAMLADAQMRFPLDQALSPLIARLERMIARRTEEESIGRIAEIACKPAAEQGDRDRSQPIAPDGAVAFEQPLPEYVEPLPIALDVRQKAQETHTANDDGLASSGHSRAGASPFRQQVSGRTPNSLVQGGQPVTPPLPPQTETRDARPEPASPSPKRRAKRAFHPVQRYTIIGLAASLVLALLVVGHLIHSGHAPNPSSAEVRVVIMSNPAGAAIHVEGNARSVDCVTPQCILSLPLGRYSVAATTPNLPPVTQSMEVKSSMGPVEVTFPPVPLGTTATLVVQTPGVQNAHVFVNGSEYPTAGSELRIPAVLKATYSIHAEKAGYDPSPERTVTLSHSNEMLAIILKPSVVVPAPNHPAEIAPTTPPLQGPAAGTNSTVYAPPSPQPQPQPPSPQHPEPSVISKSQPVPSITPSPKPPSEPIPSREQQDKSEISALLSAYRQAYDNRSVDQMRRIYPAMTARDTANLQQVFRLASAIHTTKLDVQSLRVNGDSAQAVCAQSMQVMSSGRNQPVNSVATFWLSRQSGRWLIQRIQSANR